MLWIDGWNDLYDWLSRLAPEYIVDEQWRDISLEDCKGLIQTAAYKNEARVRFRQTFFKGKAALQFFFSPAEPSG